MKRILATLGAALAVLFLADANVRADSIPWGYSATATTIFNNNNPIQSSQVNIQGSSGVASGNSGIIIYNLTASSGALSSAPDSFTNVPFNLAVTLTDVNSTSSSSPSAVSSGTVNFAGLFNATNVTGKSLLPGTNTWTSPMTTNVVLGANDTGWSNYNVQVISFTPPGQPGGAPGSIEAVVTITPASGPSGSSGGSPSTAPEPASLVLAGLGLPLFILLRRRSKKTQAEDNMA